MARERERGRERERAGQNPETPFRVPPALGGPVPSTACRRAGACDSGCPTDCRGQALEGTVRPFGEV
eukprot:928905-Alexandrium_andersonii.AAC.1